MSKIPKIIHQIWIGDKNMPDYCKEFCERMKKTHKMRGWEYKFWGNELLDVYKDDIFIKNYLKDPELYKWAHISDRIRHLMLRDNGGVYVDIDCNIIKPLDYIMDQLSDNITFFCGARKGRLTHGCMFEIALMGCVKNSRITNAVLDSYEDINWANGGSMHSDVILMNIDPDVAIFNYKRFYDLELTEHTVVLHDPYNLGSWYKSKEELEELGYKSN